MLTRANRRLPAKRDGRAEDLAQITK